MQRLKGEALRRHNAAALKRNAKKHSKEHAIKTMNWSHCTNAHQGFMVKGLTLKKTHKKTVFDTAQTDQAKWAKQLSTFND